MKIEYLPDTYDKKRIEENGWTEEQFLSLQEKYRTDFIHDLLDTIDIDKIKSIITSCPSTIPVIEDQEYNFYHRSAIIDKYLYLRNNIHIERLSQEELEELYNSVLVNKELSKEFITQTKEKVLYEEGDYTYYGIPSNKTEAPSKSIVIEFAYDQLKCESVEQIVHIKDCYKEIQESLNKTSKDLDTPLFSMLENGVSSVFTPPKETMIMK